MVSDVIRHHQHHVCIPTVLTSCYSLGILLWDIILLRSRMVRKIWPIFVVSDVIFHHQHHVCRPTYILLMVRINMINFCG